MTITDERMALRELVEKEADGDLVREMLAFAAKRLKKLDTRKNPALRVPSYGLGASEQPFGPGSLRSEAA